MWDETVYIHTHTHVCSRVVVSVVGFLLPDVRVIVPVCTFVCVCGCVCRVYLEDDDVGGRGVGEAYLVLLGHPPAQIKVRV